MRIRLAIPHVWQSAVHPLRDLEVLAPQLLEGFLPLQVRSEKIADRELLAVCETGKKRIE